MKTGVAIWVYPALDMIGNVERFGELGFTAVSALANQISDIEDAEAAELDRVLGSYGLDFTVHWGLPKPGDEHDVARFHEIIEGCRRLHAGCDRIRNFTFDAWREEAWGRYAGEIHREIDFDGETCGTLVSRRNKWSNKVGTDEDCWLNSWFQTLRTAYGMFLHGRRG